MKRIIKGWVWTALLLAAVGAGAQVPQLIQFQGRVDAPDTLAEGAFKFAFVDGRGAETFWSNDGSSAKGAEPKAALKLPLDHGRYTVLLGDATLTNMSLVPATVFTHADVRLRVWFNDGPGGFKQLSPDQRIAAVGYALMAANVPDGLINTAKLANGAVTADKLANASVQTRHLADGAVTSAKVAPGSVGMSALADGAVGPRQLAAGAVGPAQLAPGAIQANHLGAGVVGNANLAKASVGNANLMDAAVDTRVLAKGAVTSAQLAAGSVQSAHLAKDSVTADKLAARSVTTSALGDGAVGAKQLAVGAVGTAQLAKGAVTAGQLAGNAVTAAALADHSVNSAKIADHSITGADIGTEQIQAGHLAAGAVTSAKLAPGAVGGAALADGAIQAAKLDAALVDRIDARPPYIEFMRVGNPGNKPDTNGLGGVKAEFRIGKYEVYNRQYADFLNAVDPRGRNKLKLYHDSMGKSESGGILWDGARYVTKPGMAYRPVNYVNLYDAMRFANWLHNGATVSADTESGAYNLQGGRAVPANGATVERDAGARFWIPSEDEWYKAAYHQPKQNGGAAGDYWRYPTRSNTAPVAGPPDARQAAANYGFALKSTSGVGSYAESGSYYQTFDQGGNVWEWNDTLIDGQRGLRGGSWFNDQNCLESGYRHRNAPETTDASIGFRVAGRP